jgi:uncharacterized repeat protein (TIGR01451 family)
MPRYPQSLRSVDRSMRYCRYLGWWLAIVGIANILAPAAIADPIPAPGTPINNVATGSYEDDTDPTSVNISSNQVSVTFAEVAGISLTSTTVAEVPISAFTSAAGAPTNPGSYQGDSLISAGDLVYYEFKITNTGNDTTQFFLPGVATVGTGGTVEGSLQIVSYSADGTTQIPLTNPIDIPAAGGRTGSDGASNNGLLTTNGSFAPNGSVTVRVPVRISPTAAVGANINVKLGNTTGTNTDNQYFGGGAAADEVRTIDNPDSLNVSGETAGAPAGISVGTTGEKESSLGKSVTLVVPTLRQISGTVFEDVNYGGGNGRNYTAANTSATTSGFTTGAIRRSGAIVELYEGDNLIKTTTTDSNGRYQFGQIDKDKTYQVRVINSSVTSSRPGANNSLIPVQTFRTETDTSNSLIGVLNRVGGETPALVDAPANSGSQLLSALNTSTQQVQSIAMIKAPNNDVDNIDFGFNFDTIVNTRDSGQGSLRQFIINSNQLTNAKLKQDLPNTYTPVNNQASNQEVSIWMIPVAGINGTASNSNAAVITLAASSPLPIVTDANTSIDATTQTINIGDRNSGQIGTGGNVGVSNNSLSKINLPEVVIDGRNLGNSTNGDQYAVTFNAASGVLRGTAIYGTKGFYGSSAQGDTGAVKVTSSGTATIQGNAIGTFADGSDPGVNLQNQRYGTICQGVCTVTNNYYGFNGYGVLINGASANGSKVTNNEFQFNGANQAPSANSGSADGDSIAIWSASTVRVEGNLIANTRANSSNVLDAGKGVEIVDTDGVATTGNIITNNTIDRASTAGIGLYNGAIDTDITLNIIKNTTKLTGTNTGAGVLLSQSGALNNSAGVTTPIGNTISRNSMFDNAGLGIDIDPTAWNTGNGVTANNNTLATNIPNQEIDYPVFESFTKIGTTKVRVMGYVGTPNQTNSPFSGATIEVFGADKTATSTSDAGKVLVTDNLNKPHGEGKVYLGNAVDGTAATVGNDGKFDFIIDTAGVVGFNQYITATATKNRNTSEFSPILYIDRQPPKLLLVKRITKLGNNNYNNIVYRNNDQNEPDRNSKWPANYLKGEIEPTTPIRPNDEIEYTIYFMNVGEQDAKKVKICDLIRPNQAFIPSTYNATTTPANDGGLNGDRGIELNISNNPFYLTNINDAPDRGEFLPPNTAIPAVCKITDPNASGVTIVDVTKNTSTGADSGIAPATTQATPNSYGFIRFRTRVQKNP